MTEPATSGVAVDSAPLPPEEVERRLATVNALTDAQRNHVLGTLTVLVTSGDFTAAVTRAEDCIPPTSTVSR